MANCNQLIDDIRSGEPGIARAMASMCRDTEFLKISKYLHGRCPPANQVLIWEDFLFESLLRFVEQTLKGAQARNCGRYFWGICLNYCREQCRKLKIPANYSPQYDSDTQMDELAQAISPYLEKLSAQCQLLLTLAFYQDPPVTDKVKLAEILKSQGYDVQPSTISTLISRCKRNLKDLIGPDLDSFI